MPPRMFKNVGYVAIIAIAVVGAMVYFSLTVLWPTIIGTLYTTDSMQIGWQSSVVGGGVLLGQTIGGLCISYVPKVKHQVIIASAIALATATSLTTISPDRWSATIALGILLLTCELHTAGSLTLLRLRGFPYLPYVNTSQPLASSRISPYRVSRLSGRHKTSVSQPGS